MYYYLNIFDFCVSLVQNLIAFWQMIPVAFDTDFVLWFNSVFGYVPGVLRVALEWLTDTFVFENATLGDVIISCVTNSFLFVVIARFIALCKSIISK